MKYISTRGEAQATGFVEAVLSGLAPDGGLYIPDAWPTFSPQEIAAFAGRPYAEVATEVIGRFAAPAIAKDDLAAMCQAAYASFTHPCVTPLKELYPGLWLLELFHGPTLAFKDVAMQLLAQLYDHVLGLQRRTLTIVCATSGDTGGAAVEAFRGRHNVRIVALFPEGRISEVQRRFMTTASEDNVRCVAVEGTFDDCQTILKSMFQDEAFARDVDLSGVNSINWARIAAQAVYYFTAAVALGAPHRPVSFAVPTGNFGDAFAGYVASRMGLPIERIIVATNGNDILARALEGGEYARGAVLATQSPAMDIQIASNFERLFFEAANRDSDVTAAAFRAFAAEAPWRIRPQRAGANAQALRRHGGQRGRDHPHHRLDLQRDRRDHRPAHRRRRRRRPPDRRRPAGRAADRTLHRPSGKVPGSHRGGRRRHSGAAELGGRSLRQGRALRPPASRRRCREGLRPRLRERLRAMPSLHTLANGVRLVCDPIPGFETLALSVVIGRGARWEDAHRHGWSHLLEHMVCKGAGKRSARDIVEVIEAEGGQLNAATGYERTSFQLRALDGGLPLGMAVISDLVFEPVIDAAELRREKGVIAQEIAEAADMPDDLVFDIAQTAAFGDHPLGRPILGTIESIGTATHTELAAFRAGLYAPDRIVVSAAGCIDEDELLAETEALFGHARSHTSWPEPAGALRRGPGDPQVPSGAGAPGVPAARLRRRRSRLLPFAHLHRGPGRGDVLAPVPGGAGEAGAGLQYRRLCRHLCRYRDHGRLRRLRGQGRGRDGASRRRRDPFPGLWHRRGGTGPLPGAS